MTATSTPAQVGPFAIFRNRYFRFLWTGQLVSTIQSSLLFCRNQTKLFDLNVDRVLLCGGGARLKGLPERAVLWRHAFPNALGPTLQVIALNIAYLAGGVVIVESLFNFRGLGIALRDAIPEANAPVVQFILDHAECAISLVENPTQLEKILSVKKE